MCANKGCSTPTEINCSCSSGARGPQGFEGPAGVAGVAGPAGATGATGPIGLTGADGADGGEITYTDLTEYQTGITVPLVPLDSSLLINNEDAYKVSFDIGVTGENTVLVLTLRDATALVDEVIVNQSITIPATLGLVSKVELYMVKSGTNINCFYRMIPIKGNFVGYVGNFVSVNFFNVINKQLDIFLNEIAEDGYVRNVIVEKLRKI